MPTGDKWMWKINNVEVMGLGVSRLTLDNNSGTLGPSIVMHRDDATPADGDVLSKIAFDGNDSGGNQTTYAIIDARIVDVTNTTEDGSLDFLVRSDGSLVSAIKMEGADTSSSPKIGIYGVTPVEQGPAYTVTNLVTDRTYDANSTTVEELADVLGSLLADLKVQGLYG